MTGTVEDALRHHYALSGLPADGGQTAATWILRFGPLSLRLRNFSWRQRALSRHDVHHVLTGYACTPTGEMEMAAWEFAAGRFPNVFSTAFCLPLVALGALTMPRRSLAAFARGRRSRTLYALPSSTNLALLSLSTLRKDLLPAEPTSMTFVDVALYSVLAVVSLAAVLVGPIALLAIIFANGPASAAQNRPPSRDVQQAL